MQPPGASPNPRWTRAALATCQEAGVVIPTPEAMARFEALSGTSLELPNWLAANPSWSHVLRDDLEPITAGRVHSEVVAALSAQDFDDFALATLATQHHRQAILSIAIRDAMGRITTRQASQELADLAQGILSGIVEVLAGPTPDLCVLGMGKLGGRELNYISDIDVMFVHEGDTQAAITLAKRVLYIASARTTYGQLYDMDANLRPEGRNGALSRTIEGYEAYWQRWAKTWEFQALIKARPVAGNLALGERWLATASPYVWPDTIGAQRVVEIRQMKAQVEASRPVVQDGSRHLKLAPGGIRDIEFAVQLLQLVHGSPSAGCQQPGTHEAIEALGEAGYIRESDAQSLTDLYWYLRTVEHRVQLRTFVRSHSIPQDHEAKRRLAHTMGVFSQEGQDSVARFEREIASVQGRVRQAFTTLFYAPLLETIAQYDVEQMAVASGHIHEQAALVRLQALGFYQPKRALVDMQTLATLHGRLAKPMREILPSMLEVLSQHQDPDGGLSALRDMALALPKHPDFLTIIRDNPTAARLLSTILGTAPRLGRTLVTQPGVLYELDTPQGLETALTVDQLAKKVTGIARREPTTAIAALLSFKRRQLLRTTIRAIIKRVSPANLGRELAQLGDAVIALALTKAREYAQAQTGQEVQLVFIAMGRYASCELGLSSDLDGMMVHQGDTPTAILAVEYLLGLLGEGALGNEPLTVDVNLRPEGKNGPVSRTLESYETYWARWAEPWERLALTQARIGAGDAELGARTLASIHAVAYGGMNEHAVTAIRQMKVRIEQERSGPSLSITHKGLRTVGTQPALRGGSTMRGGAALRGGGSMRAGGPVRGGAGAAIWGGTGPGGSVPGGGDHGGDGLGYPEGANIKLGPGGLSDIEWLVHMLAITHPQEETLHDPGTVTRLGALQTSGLLSPEELAWLRQGWELCSRVRNGLYVMGVGDTDHVPTDPRMQARLAQVMHHGEGGAQALLEDIARSRRRVRKVFDRHFWTTAQTR